MKRLLTVAISLTLASCAMQSATFMLSEPGESRNRTVFPFHSAYLDENRMLIFDGEEKFLVPEGKQVRINIVRGEETAFTLEDI